MSGELQRVFIALLGRPLLARGDGLQVVRRGQVVLLDQLRVRQQAGSEAPRQRRFADALGSGKQQRLRNSLLRDHLLQRFGNVRRFPRNSQTCALTMLQTSRSISSMPARPSTSLTRSGSAAASAW